MFNANDLEIKIDALLDELMDLKLRFFNTNFCCRTSRVILSLEKTDVYLYYRKNLHSPSINMLGRKTEFGKEIIKSVLFDIPTDEFEDSEVELLNFNNHINNPCCSLFRAHLIYGIVYWDTDTRQWWRGNLSRNAPRSIKECDCGAKLFNISRTVLGYSNEGRFRRIL